MATRAINLTFQTTDADKKTSPWAMRPIAVKRKAKAKAKKVTLFKGFTDATGRVRIELAKSKTTKTAKATKAGAMELSVEVHDLDGKAFEIHEVGWKTGGKDPVIRVDAKKLEANLRVAIGDGRALLGKALSPKVRQRLGEKKIETLEQLQTTASLSTKDLNAGERNELRTLRAHAVFQLISRNAKANLAGNILSIDERVSDCDVPGSIDGMDRLLRQFDYDPLYRLTSATGRETDPPAPPWIEVQH